jgi:transposase
MNATTVAIDLAKDVFELAFADSDARIVQRKRLSRARLAAEFQNRPAMTVVMEACSSSHYWARRLAAMGHQPLLLPAQHAKPFVRGNKTDRSDVAGLLTAFAVGDIRPVPIKTAEQQGVQGLHRIREHHKHQRTATINVVRGLLREFGVAIPVGAAKLRPAAIAALEDAENDLPMALRHRLHELLEEIAAHSSAMARIESDLAEFAARDVRSQRYQTATGVGLITATALSAGQGELGRFPSGRHFASSLGLTPREFSSGNSRRLGKLTRRGDVYLRQLLIHGARSLLQSAAIKRRQGKDLDRLAAWALQLSDRVGHNKAACAVANKLARRLWAAEHHRTSFDPNHVSQPPVAH